MFQPSKQCSAFSHISKLSRSCQRRAIWDSCSFVHMMPMPFICLKWKRFVIGNLLGCNFLYYNPFSWLFTFYLYWARFSVCFRFVKLQMMIGNKTPLPQNSNNKFCGTKRIVRKMVLNGRLPIKIPIHFQIDFKLTWLQGQ